MNSMNIIIELDGVRYVRSDVVQRVYALMQDQKKYFQTRDKSLLVDCKQREANFLRFCETYGLTDGGRQ